MLSAAGIAYLLLLGWRLLPTRDGPPRRDDTFDIQDCVTEARLLPSSLVIGLEVAQYEASRNARILGIVRDGRRVFGRTHAAVLQSGDILLLEADTAALERTIEADQLELVERERQPAQAGERDLVWTGGADYRRSARAAALPQQDGVSPVRRLSGRSDLAIRRVFARTHQLTSEVLDRTTLADALAGSTLEAPGSTRPGGATGRQEVA